MSHLTDQQLQTFQRRLLQAKSEIKRILDQTVADSRPVDLDLPIGRLTRIDAIQMQGMAQMNRHQLSIRLQQVDASLLSFDSKNFGICRHCKEPIHLGRLEVLPETPFCIECQESFEAEG
jgi:DnaK suppressor protein